MVGSIGGVFVRTGRGSSWIVQAMGRNSSPPRAPTAVHAVAAVTVASRFSGRAASRCRRTNTLPVPDIILGIVLDVL